VNEPDRTCGAYVTTRGQLCTNRARFRITDRKGGTTYHRCGIHSHSFSPPRYYLENLNDQTVKQHP
jgi:hypothetical protein